MISSSKARLSVSYAKKSLRRLAKELEKLPEDLSGVPLRYYNTVIEGPNKLSKRKERVTILQDLLSR